MRLRLTRIVMIAALLLVYTGELHAQIAQTPDTGEKQKKAQAGMRFVSLSIDPRAAAMGNAVTAMDMGAASVFYNPSALSHIDGLGSVSLGQVQWIADITYNQGSLALQPANGQYGVVGLSIRSVDYGTFERTRRDESADQGYVRMPNFSPSGTSVGLTYSRTITDRFSVGGSAKYVRQNLGTGSIGLNEGSVVSRDFSLSTAAFDFGIMYEPGIQSLQFAMSARNFSPAIEYVQESFELPLTLNVGVSMDVMDFAADPNDTHSLLIAVDTAHPRDFSKTISLGGEYTFMDIISFRGGYTVPTEEQGINLGAGLHYGFSGLDVRADYAYSDMGVFGTVNRLALQVGF